MRKIWLSAAVAATLMLLLGLSPSAAASEEGTVYVVQRGDTLYRIGRRYGVSVGEIVRANGIVNPNLIYVGQRLTIPTDHPADQPETTVHVVKRGENLFRIALRYGVDMWAVVRANDIANPNYIYVGQRLSIPGGEAPDGPSPTPSPEPTPAPPDEEGGFELGGQTLTLSHPDQMHYAGMNWVKLQVRWTPGMSGSDAADRIERGHAEGFKVLLSIVGRDEYPSDIDFAGYVEFLRQVAEQGPDAIEVWNEENLDREWPAGQIDPTVYVQQMLAPAYNAIKSVDPSILVISGAPAPTGFFGGRCTGVGCDDAPYVAGMLAAGAAGYLDCVGVHYNEGILPPSRTSGDPRGYSSHYTRYFWGMVNTYYDRFGGQEPLCFTELGYLSPEGYGALPAGFTWAADTSVDEQAAWLAEAARLSVASGKIRLLIVYNVDLTLWSDQDPQAGYAIIRPDGSCPACEALHTTMSAR